MVPLPASSGRGRVPGLADLLAQREPEHPDPRPARPLHRRLHPLAAALVQHQRAAPALDPRGGMSGPLDRLHPLPPVHVSPERQGRLPRPPQGRPPRHLVHADPGRPGQHLRRHPLLLPGDQEPPAPPLPGGLPPLPLPGHDSEHSLGPEVTITPHVHMSSS